MKEFNKKCGVTEYLIFISAIASGTSCSICSKLMMDLHSIGMDNTVEQFTKPLFQTFGMFLGMMFGLIMHWMVLYFKLPFPGYEHEVVGSSHHGNGVVLGQAHEGSTLLPAPQNKEEKPKMTSTPVWMYFFLAIPSVFDLVATALCMCGLRYLPVSIYQMLRGSGIIFVALMKQHFLGHHQLKYQWIGVFWNVVSVVIIGATAMMNESGGAGGDDNEQKEQHAEALLGVLLVMAGAFVQALQFVFEEKVMTMEIPAQPLLLIGMEGAWGTIICLLVMYPLAYITPGSDHGSYENPWNTWIMIQNSKNLQYAFYVYFITVFLYNLFAVLVTFLLSSVWHAILDNFRPITVWITDLFIFYVVDQAFGEPWTTWSPLQGGGMLVLLYGTGIYNAPNAGSILLEGQWYAFGIDLSKEYQQVILEQEEADLDAKWAMLDHRRRTGSFMGEMEPMESIHTQALRGGFGSPKI